MCECRMDKLHMALTELCFAINYCSVITVWEHGFVPRDFFTQPLESASTSTHSLCVPAVVAATRQPLLSHISSCDSGITARQPLLSHISSCHSCMSLMQCTLPLEATEDIWTVNSALGPDQQWLKSVSYTHLTLPTIYSV